MCFEHSAVMCGCDSDFQGTCGAFWTRDRKIRMLEKKLETMDHRKEELETLLRELKEEK